MSDLRRRGTAMKRPESVSNRSYVSSADRVIRAGVGQVLVAELTL